MRQAPKIFALGGGLNEVTPPSMLKGGELYGVSNYEPGEKGGYRRIDGYERLDGKVAPSDASYWILNFDAGDIVEPESHGLCEGATSGATGEVVSVILESGAWADSDAVGYIVLFDVKGSFQDNETLTFTGSHDGFNSGFSNGFG